MWHPWGWKEIYKNFRWQNLNLETPFGNEGFNVRLGVHVELTFKKKLWDSSRCGSSYYSGADKSLARPTSRYILFDGENISSDASLVTYMFI